MIDHGFDTLISQSLTKIYLVVMGSRYQLTGLSVDFWPKCHYQSPSYQLANSHFSILLIWDRRPRVSDNLPHPKNLVQAVWLSAGRPSSGNLYQVMCHTRMKYHRAVKKLKRLAATAKAQHLLEASEAGDLALVKELKKTLLDKPLGQSVPECVEGKVTHESIPEVFRNCYSEL